MTKDDGTETAGRAAPPDQGAQAAEEATDHRPGGVQRRRTEPTFPEPLLSVHSWPDPVLDQLGHDPRSGYVERFWLPILGPSCLLLIRRMAAELERRPEGFELESAVWARELGIGMKGGQHGPFWRAVERACRFGAARRNGPRLALRRRLAPLTSRQIQRLPESLRSDHDEWVAARLERPRRATITQWTPRLEPGVGGDGPAPPPVPIVEVDDAA